MSDSSQPLIVSKFGGSSVADADRIRNVCRIIEVGRADGGRIVVVSALGGMTDKLIEAIDAAEARTGEPAEAVGALVDRYERAANQLLPSDARSELFTFVNHYWAELRELLDGIYLLRECTPRSRDAVMAIGELVTAPLVAATLSASGTPALAVDAREFVKTDDAFGEANVDFKRTNAEVRKFFESVPSDHVAVVTGFVALTEEGVTATLGRSGSDYTATLLGAALDADRVDIWTDVDGVLSADPRVVPDAYTIEELSYVEAGELAYFGAKVLHPRTMRPLMAKSIPLLIKNTFNPSASGTRISETGREAGGRVKAITSVRDIAVVMIEGTGMAGVPGVAARAFGALAARSINVLMISQASSEQSICIVVKEADADPAVRTLTAAFELEIARQDISRIHAIHGCAVISAVGDRMRHQPGLAGRMFSALGRSNVNVLAIAQGASETNISAVVEAQDVRPALTTLHTTFARPESRAHVFVFGSGGVATYLFELLDRQESWLRENQRFDLKLVGAANTRKLVWNGDGVLPSDVTRLLSGSNSPSDHTATMERLLSSQLDRLIVVDATASDEVAASYLDLLRRGISVVTANKKANSREQDFYDRLKEAQREGLVPYLYETTVGAALPVLTTIRDLVDSGDEIVRIRAVLSGTLAYVFSEISEGRVFSEAVVDARARGFTEPDPREDLRGADIRRKLVIMAREMGLRIEPEAVELEPLLEESLYAGDVESFMDRLPETDAYWAERVLEANEAGQRLHYIGEVSREAIHGRVESFDAATPFGSLRGTDNLFAFETRRHEGNPFIVGGPGAGPESTAGGVLADILIAARTMR